MMGYAALHPSYPFMWVIFIVANISGCIPSGVSQSICVYGGPSNSQIFDGVARLLNAQGFIFLTNTRYNRNDAVMRGATFARKPESGDCEAFGSSGCIYVFLNSYAPHNKIGLTVWESHKPPSTTEAVKAFQTIVHEIIDIHGVDNVSRIYQEVEATVFAEVCRK